jgi:hypothetical protein
MNETLCPSYKLNSKFFTLIIYSIMEERINDIIRQIEDLDIEEQQWGYRQVFREACAASNVAVEIIDQVLRIIYRRFGQYGSVNLGNNGQVYTRIRNELTEVYNLTFTFNVNREPVENQQFQNLLKFLADSGYNLPAYDGSGAGGQGDAKQNLNCAIATVYKRAYTVIGALRLQSFINNWGQVIF